MPQEKSAIVKVGKVGKHTVKMEVNIVPGSCADMFQVIDNGTCKIKQLRLSTVRSYIAHLHTYVQCMYVHTYMSN